MTLLNTDTTPRRSAVWLVNLAPTVGREIRKTRPVVVISSDAAGKLPIKLIAPITDWKNSFAKNFWHVRINPNSQNNLTKVSAVDTLQLRRIDIQRFIRNIGNISERK